MLSLQVAVVLVQTSQRCFEITQVLFMLLRNRVPNIVLDLFNLSAHLLLENVDLLSSDAPGSFKHIN